MSIKETLSLNQCWIKTGPYSNPTQYNTPSLSLWCYLIRNIKLYLLHLWRYCQGNLNLYISCASCLSTLSHQGKGKFFWIKSFLSLVYSISSYSTVTFSRHGNKDLGVYLFVSYMWYCEIIFQYVKLKRIFQYNSPLWRISI